MNRLFLLFLPLLLLPSLLPALLHAEEMSLVDRVMSILGKGNLPRIEVRPKSVTSEAAGPPLPPPRAGVEIARNFLPVYSLERGMDDGDNASVLPFFASGPVIRNYPDITTLLVMLPDADREAAKAFAFARAAQEDAMARKPEWAADGVYIFAPQFLTPEDIAAHASSWPDGGKALLRWVSESWVWGQESAADPDQPDMWMQKRGLSSYTVLDYVLLMLITPQRFPHLQRVVIAGTGAGADLTQRYAVLGVAPDMLMEDGLEVRFVAGGARSYLYLDKNRAVKKPFGQYGEDPDAPAFNEVTEESCRAANLYPYGLDALPAYGRRQGANDMRLRFGQRRVVYLQSAEAIDPLPDTTPEACALGLQGNTLKERARTYYASLDRLYGEELPRTQRMYMLPKLGTEPLAMWRHPCGMAALFGDGGCTADTLVTFGPARGTQE
jgi:hypothetical protein